MKKRILSILSLLLLLSIAFNLSACSSGIQSSNLMDGITAQKVNFKDDIGNTNSDVTDFAVRLFKATNEDGKNTLVSPLSVLAALAMTANGADGKTLEEMENTLGMTKEELNLYLYTYMNSLPIGEKYKLSLANSIWFTDDERLSVNENFLQTNANYYSADIYKTPFDNSTVNDINNWVKEKTDGMIPKILAEIPDQAIMYLINALAFEAEWQEIYEKNQVKERKFTKENGEEQDVELMYGSEGLYLEDDKATGFIKYYNGRKYAFVALLPNEGISVQEYVNSLDGKALNELLSSAEKRTVNTAIPKFETEYDTEMSEILKAMGMQTAFDNHYADFGNIGEWTEGPIYIGKVLHKTYIQVGEKGTRAGAVTAVQIDGATSADPGEIKRVYLDRPFVYMLIDCENNIPFFIGTLMDVNE